MAEPRHDSAPKSAGCSCASRKARFLMYRSASGSDMPAVRRVMESAQTHCSCPVQTRPGGPFKTSR